MGPRAYLEDHPTAYSVRLGGRYINLQRLANEENFNHSYLSRIVSGDRTPSLPYYQRLADALQMELQDLIDAIADRKVEIKAKLQRQLGLSV